MSGQHIRPNDPEDPGGNASGLQLARVLLVIGGLAIVLMLINLMRPDDTAGTTTTLLTATATTVTEQVITTTTVPVLSSTTVAVPSTSAATSSTLGDPLVALVLTPTGVGGLDFGTDATETVDQINLVLGPPDQDTGWTPTFETCPGTESRLVRWSSLQIFLTNGATGFAPEGTRHFFHYGQSIAAGGGEYLDLFTDSGLGLGSNVGQLRVAYGDRVTISDDPLFGPFWEVTSSGSGFLWGTANGIDDESIINAINGGPGCGE